MWEDTRHYQDNLNEENLCSRWAIGCDSIVRVTLCGHGVKHGDVCEKKQSCVLSEYTNNHLSQMAIRAMVRKVYTAYTSFVGVSIFVTPHFTVQEPDGIKCCASFRRLHHHHRSGMWVLFVLIALSTLVLSTSHSPRTISTAEHYDLRVDHTSAAPLLEGYVPNLFDVSEDYVGTDSIFRDANVTQLISLRLRQAVSGFY